MARDRDTGRRRSQGGRGAHGPLTRARVVSAAVDLADSAGMTAVTMRATAAALGVEAMSLYNHVTNREDLIDGMVDAVFAEIGLPKGEAPWRDEMRDMAVATRRALQRHAWSIGMLDSRTKPGEATLRHHDAALGVLRRSGFSTTTAVRVLAILDSYVYGSVMQERSLPLDEGGDQAAAAGGLLKSLSVSDYPYLAEVALDRARATEAVLDMDDEFSFGLDLILDGLARLP